MNKRRHVLLVTADQQRYDALGCNGGIVAQTPVADRLAAEGIRYENMRNNNVVCMPSRTTLLTGQHPLTHGVVCNGVPYPAQDGTSLAHWLKRKAGYRTAMVGKAHFDPHIDPLFRFRESQLAAEGSTGPWLGFEHAVLATHGPLSGMHYSKFLMEKHPDKAGGFATVLMGEGGGDTGAPEVAHNPIPKELYHTDWVADEAIRWLKGLDGEDPFFMWLSFPDPHHPFDPPVSELHRVNWRDLDLPPGRPRTREQVETVLRQKPRHWLDWYAGRFHNPEGGPISFRPGALTEDQVREMSAMIHIQNEMIDEALGRVLDCLESAGMLEDTDVFYTSDHGDHQGDFGLFFKGPYLVDSLMRVPFIWRPAPGTGIKSGVVRGNVSHVDFVPTACAAAGVSAPPWAQGTVLPVSGKKQEGVTVNTWDSQFREVGMHLRQVTDGEWSLIQYLPSSKDQGGRFPVLERLWGEKGKIPAYDGSEGELYHLSEDPMQWQNLWDNAGYAKKKKELLETLREAIPPARTPGLRVEAPT